MAVQSETGTDVGHAASCFCLIQELDVVSGGGGGSCCAAKVTYGMWRDQYPCSCCQNRISSGSDSLDGRRIYEELSGSPAALQEEKLKQPNSHLWKSKNKNIVRYRSVDFHKAQRRGGA